MPFVNGTSIDKVNNKYMILVNVKRDKYLNTPVFVVNEESLGRSILYRNQ